MRSDSLILKIKFWLSYCFRIQGVKRHLKFDGSRKNLRWLLIGAWWHHSVRRESGVFCIRGKITLFQTAYFWGFGLLFRVFNARIMFYASFTSSKNQASHNSFMIRKPIVELVCGRAHSNRFNSLVIRPRQASTQNPFFDNNYCRIKMQLYARI